MRACVQRVRAASVTVGGDIVGQIDHGLVVLLGVAQGDTEQDAKQLADKIVRLRIFEDDQDKMNRSLVDTGGSMLVVSQFTLLGDCRKGRRPSFAAAATPELAEQLYELFVAEVAGQGIGVETGQFRTMMDVSLINSGPVTLLLDTKQSDS